MLLETVPLLVGLWDGQKFAQYEIPFSSSKYRHLQRGLIKQKGVQSLLRMMTIMGEESEHEMVGSEVQNASVLQGGHTLRTAFSHYAQTSAAEKIKLYSESNRIELFRLASHE